MPCTGVISKVPRSGLSSQGVETTGKVDMALPFQAGDWLIDRNNPGRPGQFTGRSQEAGPLITLELSLPDGTTTWRPLNVFELMEHAQQSLKVSY